MAVFGNGVIADGIRMRSSWRRVGPKSNDWCLYKKRQCDGRGRDWGDAAASQGRLELPEAGGDKEGSFPRAFRGSMVLPTLRFQLSGPQRREKVQLAL